MTDEFDIRKGKPTDEQIQEIWKTLAHHSLDALQRRISALGYKISRATIARRMSHLGLGLSGKPRSNRPAKLPRVVKATIDQTAEKIEMIQTSEIIGGPVSEDECKKLVERANALMKMSITEIANLHQKVRLVTNIIAMETLQPRLDTAILEPRDLAALILAMTDAESGHITVAPEMHSDANGHANGKVIDVTPNPVADGIAAFRRERLGKVA